MSSSLKQPQPISSAADSATSEVGSVPVTEDVEKLPRDLFAKVRGELTEEEFATPVVSRMLLDRISDLRSQLQEEKSYRPRFYQADKDKAVLEEKFKTRISSEVMFGVCLSAGSILISVAPVMPATSNLPSILLWVGVILFLGAVISRIIILKKK